LADVGGVVTPGDAQVGGQRLSDFVDGLRATDRGAPEDLTLIGHSYGATTAAYAAHDGAAADQYVLLGSPGAPTPTAGQLTHGDVYVGAADYDPVSLLGLGSRGGVGALGYDPAQESFGATRFDVAPGSYRVEDLFHNHTSYFGGRSLDNITDIATGGDPTVDAGRSATGDGYYQNLGELLAGSTTTSGGAWLFDQGRDLVDGFGHFGDSLLDVARPHP
jgi:pimeloyl-ACP methyl ester carboxylesterase